MNRGCSVNEPSAASAQIQRCCSAPAMREEALGPPMGHPRGADRGLETHSARLQGPTQATALPRQDQPAFWSRPSQRCLEPPCCWMSPIHLGGGRKKRQVSSWLSKAAQRASSPSARAPQLWKKEPLPYFCWPRACCVCRILNGPSPT